MLQPTTATDGQALRLRQGDHSPARARRGDPGKEPRQVEEYPRYLKIEWGKEEGHPGAKAKTREHRNVGEEGNEEKNEKHLGRRAKAKAAAAALSKKQEDDSCNRIKEQ